MVEILFAHVSTTRRRQAHHELVQLPMRKPDIHPFERLPYVLRREKAGERLFEGLLVPLLYILPCRIAGPGSVLFRHAWTRRTNKIGRQGPPYYINSAKSTYLHHETNQENNNPRRNPKKDSRQTEQNKTNVPYGRSVYVHGPIDAINGLLFGLVGLLAQSVLPHGIQRFCYPRRAPPLHPIPHQKKVDKVEQIHPTVTARVKPTGRSSRDKKGCTATCHFSLPRLPPSTASF